MPAWLLTLLGYMPKIMSDVPEAVKFFEELVDMFDPEAVPALPSPAASAVTQALQAATANGPTTARS